MADEDQHQPHQHAAEPGIPAQKAPLRRGRRLFPLRRAGVGIVRHEQEQQHQPRDHAHRHRRLSKAANEHTDQVGRRAVAQGAEAPGHAEIHPLSPVHRGNAHGIDQGRGHLEQHHAHAVAHPGGDPIPPGQTHHQTAGQIDRPGEEHDPFQRDAAGPVGIACRHRLKKGRQQPRRRDQQPHLTVAEPRVQQIHAAKAHDARVARPEKALDGGITNGPVFDDHNIRPIFSRGALRLWGDHTIFCRNLQA